MMPRRTPSSNVVFRLPGGNEDNDLWVKCDQIDGQPTIQSTWVLTDEERSAIARGDNVELIVWGEQQPPVCVRTTDEPIGRKGDQS